MHIGFREVVLLGRRLIVILAVTIGFATAAFYSRQRSAPPTAASETFLDAFGDREAVARISIMPRLGVIVLPGRLALPLDRGAELLEFFRIAEGARFATLRDESPLVRAYTAFHVLRTRPASAARLLKPLLADGASLSRGVFNDPTVETTVAKVVVSMACAVAQKDGYDDVRAMLAEARADWRLLSIRDAVRTCAL